MGQNNVLQSSGKIRNYKKEALTICDAVLLEPFVLKVFFTNDEQRVIDFRPFFNTLKGYYSKWNTSSNFKKFAVKKEGISWGKNDDVLIHPVDVYYNSLLYPLHDDLTEDLIQF
ncbi:MAG TPA: hypothetical protein VIJ92_11265 [Ginsengibacter sp.]